MRRTFLRSIFSYSLLSLYNNALAAWARRLYNFIEAILTAIWMAAAQNNRIFLGIPNGLAMSPAGLEIYFALLRL